MNPGSVSPGFFVPSDRLENRVDPIKMTSGSMGRTSIARLYHTSVTVIGILLLLLTTVIQAPGDLRSDPQPLLVNAAILLVLTFLSSISPLATRVGSVLTVGLAPLFGAFLVL